MSDHPKKSNGLPRIVIGAVEARCSILPVGLNKKPLIPEWTSLQTVPASLEQVCEWHLQLNPPAYALVAGEVSHRVVGDFDGREGLATMQRYGIQPHIRTGSGGGHQHLVHPGFRVPTWTGKNKAALQAVLPGFDLRGDGGYAVFWGRNESGLYQRLRPLSEPDPWVGPLIDTLMTLIRKEECAHSYAQRVSADEILMKYLDKERNGAARNETGFELCCQLRDNDIAEAEAAAVLLRYARAVKMTNSKDKPEPYTDKEALATVRSVYGKSAREPWSSPNGRRAEDTGAQQQHSQARAGDDWPQPEPLGDELPPVAAFSEELLPDSFRPLIVDTADRMQVPLDYPGTTALTCLAGAVNRRAQVQPKANDVSWVVILNLWAALIGWPGFLKSPVIQAITRFLRKIEREWRREFADAMKDYARDHEAYELRLTAWKELYKAASKKGVAAPDRPDGEPESPVLKRLIVNDSTFEALHLIMSQNPAGVLVLRDELTGWLSQLDRQGREGERQFYLESWNGDVEFTVDRISRDQTHVEGNCTAILGGIQPARLQSYLAEMLRDGPANDGLIQRIQLMVWPDTPYTWTYVDRPPDANDEAKAEQVFRRLVGLDPKNPVRLCFAPDAQELFIAWMTELEGKIRGGKLPAALTAHLSKYRKLMPALAGIYELADWAADRSTGAAITLKQAQRAAAACEYFESHARRVYSSILSPQLRAVHALAEKLRQGKVGANGTFSCRRDIYLKGWTGLDAPEVVRQAVEILEAAGWIRRLSSEPTSAGGRPADRYAINPKVAP